MCCLRPQILLCKNQNLFTTVSKYAQNTLKILLRLRDFHVTTLILVATSYRARRDIDWKNYRKISKDTYITLILKCTYEFVISCHFPYSNESYSIHNTHKLCSNTKDHTLPHKRSYITKLWHPNQLPKCHAFLKSKIRLLNIPNLHIRQFEVQQRYIPCHLIILHLSKPSTHHFIHFNHK